MVRRSVEVVLLTRDGDRFLVDSDGGGVRGLMITLPQFDDNTPSFGRFVERQLLSTHGVEAGWLGVLAADRATDTTMASVACVVTANQVPQLRNPAIVLLTLAELHARGGPGEQDRFARAQRWLRMTQIAPQLAPRIERAFTSSIEFLRGHLANEDGLLGWNLYLEGSTVGALSTAAGVLAHVYAGVTGEMTAKPAETLEALPNDDGGWQVRRSLVAASSALSVTESTCFCLQALGGIGRTASNAAVAGGIAWLERQQRRDGGWSSSAEDTESMVFPTTMAVRTLSMFGRSDAAAQGVAWLRAAQHQDDGGWGAYSPASSHSGAAFPAYTAYAICALIAAGLSPGDPVIVKACEHLRSTFVPGRAEPWEPTVFNSVIDVKTSARLEFRHFGTPLAVTALSMAGHGLGDPVLVDGLLSLLDLQQPSSAWRCGLLAPGSTPVWAIHDALQALRAVTRTSQGDLAPAALAGHLAAERVETDRLVGGMVAEDRADDGHTSRRNWVQTGWVSVLTVAVAVLALAQFGVLAQVASAPGLQKLLPGALSVIVTVAGAIAPAVIGEEYKIRRNRRAQRR